MNILAVSFAFPPLAYPRSIQVARLLAHTREPIALFSASEPGARLDRTIEPEAEDALATCIRVPVRRGVADRWIDGAAYKFARGFWNRRNLAPDAYGKWGTEVIREIERFIGRENFEPDVIVTFAQPFTDHLIGLELKRKLGLPWLAHFSDPWVDNPFSRTDDRTRGENLRLESAVAEAADILAFTSIETVDLFFRKYPPAFRDKARILAQCYSAEQRADKIDRVRDGLVIRYLGNFYGHRTPRPLITALHTLASELPERLAGISFELIGSGDADEVERLAYGLPPGLLVTRPPVDYAESLALMSSADGLLVVDAPADKSVFLPSKLIDYIGAGRPVMAISPEGSAAGLVRELGGVVADPSDIIGIVGAISAFTELLKDRQHGPDQLWGNEKVRLRYSAENIAARFRGMLAELSGQPE